MLPQNIFERLRVHELNKRYCDNRHPYNKKDNGGLLNIKPNLKILPEDNIRIIEFKKELKLAIYSFTKDIFFRKIVEDKMSEIQYEMIIFANANNTCLEEGIYKICNKKRGEFRKKIIEEINNLFKDSRYRNRPIRHNLKHTFKKLEKHTITVASKDIYLYFSVENSPTLLDGYFKEIILRAYYNLVREWKSILLKKENMLVFQDNFTITMKDQIEKLSKDFDKDTLNSKMVSTISDFFYNGYSGNNTTISLVQNCIKLIFQLIENRFKFIRAKNFNEHYRLLRKYEAQMFELEHYRDHSIHMFVVFTLGFIVINNIGKKKITKIFEEAYGPTLNLKFPVEEDPNVAEEFEKFTSFDAIVTLWAVTSLLHDISLPLEKGTKLFEKLLERELFTRDEIETAKKLDNDFTQNICNVNYNKSCYYFSKHSTNSFKILSHHLSCLYKKEIFDSCAQNSKFDKDCPFRELLRQNLQNSFDHGILSAMRIVGQINQTNEKTGKILLEILMPAISAIALHNFIFEDAIANPVKIDHSDNEYDKRIENYLEDLQDDYEYLFKFLEFERHPLAFLLVYFDSSHEWGRSDYINNYLPFKDLEVNFSEITPQKCVMNLKYVGRRGDGWKNWKKAEFNWIYSKLYSKDLEFSVKISGREYNTKLLLENIKQFDEKNKHHAFKEYLSAIQEFK